MADDAGQAAGGARPSRWNLQPPATLPDDANQKVFKRWRRDLELYLDLAMADCERTLQVKMVHYLLGSEARDLYDTFEFATDENARTVAEVLDKFQVYYDPKKNEIVERYTFFTRRQNSNESIDKYVADLKVLAKKESMFRSFVRILCVEMYVQYHLVS